MTKSTNTSNASKANKKMVSKSSVTLKSLNSEASHVNGVSSNVEKCSVVLSENSKCTQKTIKKAQTVIGNCQKILTKLKGMYKKQYCPKPMLQNTPVRY